MSENNKPIERDVETIIRDIEEKGLSGEDAIRVCTVLSLALTHACAELTSPMMHALGYSETAIVAEKMYRSSMGTAESAYNQKLDGITIGKGG